MATPDRKRELLLGSVLTCMGGFAIHWIAQQVFAFLPMSQYSSARQVLLSWGWPSWFVCGFVTFVHLEMSSYVTLGLFTLCVGVFFDRRDWPYAMMLCVWTLVAHGVMTIAHGAANPAADPMGVLLHPGAGMAACLKIPLGMTAWAMGQLFRKFAGTPSRDRDRESRDLGC